MLAIILDINETKSFLKVLLLYLTTKRLIVITKEKLKFKNTVLRKFVITSQNL